METTMRISQVFFLTIWLLFGAVFPLQSIEKAQQMAARSQQLLADHEARWSADRLLPR
jgi:hypothetical protein